MRCGSDEVINTRWETMSSQYPVAWMQWLAERIGGVSELGTVRRVFAKRSLHLNAHRQAAILVRQVPTGVLREIGRHLGGATPDLDGVWLSAGDVRSGLTRLVEADLSQALEGRRAAGGFLERLARQTREDRQGLTAIGRRAVRFLTRIAGDSDDCAGLVIQREDGAILLIRRSPHETRPGEWEFPGGHVKDDEETVAGAVRESREEVGDIPGDLKVVDKIESPIPDGIYTNVFVTTSDDEWEPELNEEHDDWGWFSGDDLPEKVNRGSLKALIDGPFEFEIPDSSSDSHDHEMRDLAPTEGSEGRVGPHDPLESAVEWAARLVQTLEAA